ncbi:MAG: hypothetical protein HFE86_01630 [Clostridiales bacterium]|nr:hypothetical protein [Clostridiales bacterium]
MLRIEMAVGGRVFAGRLYDTAAGRALAAHIPMTLDMRELNGNEKFFYLPEGLPAEASRPSGIHAGDLMLYGTDCLALFYDSSSTSYSYTPLGRLDNAAELAAALGQGNVRVTFRKNI